MIVFDAIAAALAAQQADDTWFHGSIFARRRKDVRARIRARYIAELEPRLEDELLSCWYCLLHWTAAPAVLLFVLSLIAPWDWLARIVMIPDYWLACVRFGVILDALLPDDAKVSRYEPDDARADDA